MIYIYILIFIAVLLTFHCIMYKILWDEKKQLMIVVIFACYSAITLLRRIIANINNSAFIDIASYVLTAIAVITAMIYVQILIDDVFLNKCCNVFYLIMGLILVVSSILKLCNISNIIFYLLLSGLSFVSLSCATYVTIKNRKKIPFRNKALLVSVLCMILSFVSISICDILHIKDVYYCAIGLFVYFVITESVSIYEVVKYVQKVRQNSYIKIIPENALTNSEYSIYEELLKPDIIAKDIAANLNISIKTANAQIRDIYRKLLVHSKKELIKKYQK